MARVVLRTADLYRLAKAAIQPEIERRLTLASYAARANAPRRTGAFAGEATFTVSMGEWAGWVTGRHPIMTYIEFGTSDTPKHRPMGRAVDKLLN